MPPSKPTFQQSGTTDYCLECDIPLTSAMKISSELALYRMWVCGHYGLSDYMSDMNQFDRGNMTQIYPP